MRSWAFLLVARQLRREPISRSASDLHTARRLARGIGVSVLTVGVSLTAFAAPSRDHAADATHSFLSPASAEELSFGVAGDTKKDAAAEVKAEVIVLHATNDGKGIDPTIGKIPALEKPPFSAYNTYKLLERADLKLPKGEAKDKDLPDGGKLFVTFKDVVKGKKAGEPDKFVLSASLNKADKKTFLPGVEVNAQKGEWFFIAGQKYKNGILVIGIKIP